MNILITGATGLLGRCLYSTMNTKLGTEHKIIGVGYSRAKAPLYSLDLGKEDALKAFFETHQPDVVIHAAAERKPDVCEQDPEATRALNVDTTDRLARLASQHNAKLFFISTDYVFDGKHAPYTENDEHSAVNFYGRSKSMAEAKVLASDKNHAVVRVPVLYGDVETLSESAVTIIAKHVLSDNQSAHDNWAIRYPTHVEDIALTLIDLIKLPAKQACGVFHVSDNQAMTKFDIAQTIAEILGLPANQLTSLDEPSQDAARPYNCALKDTRLSALGIHHRRPFKEALAQCLIPHLK
ncbi:dTDP-4-dehydrorhamnose reductase [Pseudoalteromonas luteoviolacea B = ATCC 29581]|nr:dTDP-4-dehydrorhamnose reductase [Pseudoalteromonas luteoviolacea B = ATCC 29581]